MLKKGKTILEKIDIHLTDHCNLNCRSCTHFSPLAEEFYLSLEGFETDLTRLSQLTNGQIGQIFMLGGEPLLHPELIKFFPIARRLFPETKLIIITNGILLPQQTDDFWQACKDNNIQIWVSLYKLNVDLKEVEQKAREYGVFYGYTSTNRTKEDEKTWGKWKLDLEGKQYWTNSFEHCSVKNCVTLKKGKLYTCPTIAHIEHFNKYFNTNLIPTEFDYVDIYKVETYDEILKAMVKPTPFCRFCKTKEFEMGLWEHSKKDINEWI